MASKTIGLAFFWCAALVFACKSSPSDPDVKCVAREDGSCACSPGGEGDPSVPCRKSAGGICCVGGKWPRSGECDCTPPGTCVVESSGYCTCNHDQRRSGKTVATCYPAGTETKPTASTGHCCLHRGYTQGCACSSSECMAGDTDVESCAAEDVAGCATDESEIDECHSPSSGGSSGSSGGGTPVVNCAKNSKTGACSCREADITLSADERKVADCNDAPSGAVVCAHYVTSDAVDACYYRVPSCGTVDRNYESCECSFRGDGSQVGTCTGSTCCRFADSCQCTTLTGASIANTQFDKSCTYEDASGVKVSSCTASSIAVECGGGEKKVTDCSGLTWAPPQTGGGSSSGSTCKSSGESCSSSLECCGLCNMNSKSASYHECE
jgi:hypothetical protein